MKKEELQQGFVVCACKKYAFVFRASMLPKGYNGELCDKCNLLVVAVDKLPPKKP